MAVDRSPDPQHPVDRLRPAERLCMIGALVVAASLLLPWYGIRFSGGLSVTGLDSFGFAHAALLLTLGAASALIARRRAGYILPRPLDEGILIAVAGAWATAIVVFLMFDRPDELGGSTDIGVRFGAFIALGGTLVVLAAGIRIRQQTKSGDEV